MRPREGAIRDRIVVGELSSSSHDDGFRSLLNYLLLFLPMHCAITQCRGCVARGVAADGQPATEMIRMAAEQPRQSGRSCNRKAFFAETGRSVAAGIGLAAGVLVPQRAGAAGKGEQEEVSFFFSFSGGRDRRGTARHGTARHVRRYTCIVIFFSVRCGESQETA